MFWTGLKMSEKAAEVQRNTLEYLPEELLIKTTLKDYKKVWLLGLKV